LIVKYLTYGAGDNLGYFCHCSLINLGRGERFPACFSCSKQ